MVVSGPTWGIVSDLDLMAGLRPGVEATAGELAASDVVVVDPSDTLEHAAQLMAEHDSAHLVVVSPETGEACRNPVDARRRPLGRGLAPHAGQLVGGGSGERATAAG